HRHRLPGLELTERHRLLGRDAELGEDLPATPLVLEEDPPEEAPGLSRCLGAWLRTYIHSTEGSKYQRLTPSSILATTYAMTILPNGIEVEGLAREFKGGV